MILRKPAAAGTLESGDVMITLQPNQGKGIEIDLQSDVEALFGDAINATVLQVLKEFEIESASVSIVDKGALDFVIRSRMQCAICRAAEIHFDWSKEDPHG